MYEKRLCGVVIPTITPMNEDGSIDDASLADFTRYLLEAGVNALYPNGTNGESLLTACLLAGCYLYSLETHCKPLPGNPLDGVIHYECEAP